MYTICSDKEVKDSIDHGLLTNLFGCFDENPKQFNNDYHVS